jgi:hypothetical protein
MTHIDLLDPTAERAAAATAPAPRLAALRGAVIGLLDNGKWNADRLLDAVAEILAREHGAAAGLHRSKPRYNHVVDEAVADELALTSRGVVVAIGD